MATLSPVLVVADRPDDAGALAAQLDRLSVATVTAAGDAAARASVRTAPIDAVVLHAPNRDLTETAALARQLKALAAPRLLAVLAVGAPDDPSGLSDVDGVDAVLRDPVHPAQIVARVNLLVRLAVMEDEARLRAQSMADRGAPVDLRLDDRSFHAPRILFAGDATPHFLGFHSALSKAGADVVASFTSFTAFDYLHERDFDAVVANAIPGREPAFTICSALRRNTRLHHVPALIFADLDRFDAADEAFSRGVSDILPAGAPPAELAGRVMTLAREHRRREAVKAAFSRARAPEVIDPLSGLAAPEFFVDHIDAMARRARAIERSLALIVLRAVSPRDVGPSARDRALRQLASMVRHLVRAEDLGAALEPGVFAIAMPGARLAEARGAGERLEGVADCTAFEGGPYDKPFQLEVVSAAAELSGLESGRALLARAVATFDPRRRSAG